MSEQPSDQERADDYDRIWNELSESGYRKQQHFKNRLFAIEWALRQVSLPPKADLLEVGCGFGTMAAALAEYGNVVGVDLSPDAIEIARRTHPNVNFEAGNILDDSLVDSQFDLVLTTEVIEHVPKNERQKFAQSLARRTKPGGTLILTTPNKVLSDRVEKFQLIEEHFTEPELRILLSPAFEIAHLTTIHRLFPVGGNTSRALQITRYLVYELLRMRAIIEDPSKQSDRGMYFLLVGQRR